MSRIIKLTEKDIKSIVKQVINEQSAGAGDMEVAENKPGMGIPPYPAPSNEQRDQITKIQGQVREKMGIRTKPEILEAKRQVRHNLIQARNWMKELLERSGVNPQTNNMEQDIEKVLQKFENLYGDPKPEDEKKKIKRLRFDSEIKL